MATDLYVKRVGQGSAVVLLHGLFGAGNNLGALARALQDSFTVFSVDLPNHGKSGWLAAVSLSHMATRLRQWMDDEAVPDAHFVGHSLGGKVAMQLADIAPVAYEPSHQSVFAALEAVVASPSASRTEAARRMAAHLHEDDVIQFLLTGLQRNGPGVFDWRFDLDGLRHSYPALLAAPEGGGQTYAGPVLFIKGGASDYLAAQHWPAVQALFPAATVKVMPGCGHWLHVQKPQLFNGIVARFLATQEQRKLNETVNKSMRDKPL
jgi:esterase